MKLLQHGNSKSLLIITIIVSLSLFGLSENALAGSPVNNPPVLEFIGFNSEDEINSAELTLFATDPDGDALTFTSSTLPLFVTLIDKGDKNAVLVFETSCSISGTYFITITVTDDGSPNLSDEETFELLIDEDCDPTPPEDTMEGFAGQIVDKLNDDTFNQGQGNALINKIDAAVKKLDQNKEHAAENILNSLINQLEAFIKSVVLIQAEGQALIDEVQLIIDTL